MWPWQLKKLPKRAIFFFKLSGVSFLLHLVFLLLLICIQGSTNKPLRFSYQALSSTQVPVVFLPLYKRIQKDQLVIPTVNKQLSSSTVAVAKKPAQSSQKVSKKAPAAKKSVPAQKTTTIPSSSKQTSSSAIKKLPEKKQGVPVKNEIRPEKKIEQKEHVPHTVTKDEQQSSEQNQLFIGREELVLLQMQAMIEQEISAVWKPPHGLSKDLSCEVMAIIGKDGKVLKTTVQKSSGVLVYDIAARTALANVTMPSWAHGKEVCITFKQ